MNVLAFPGQGSQSVGMGSALTKTFQSARHVLDEIDNTLGYKLSHIMEQGDMATLTQTEHTQPAMLAVSMMILRTMENEFDFSVQGYAHYALGHSLGEYVALCATNALSIADAAMLLHTRGLAMKESTEGGMVAILGLSIDEVQATIHEAEAFGICVIANDNSDGQIVISGTQKALDIAMNNAKSKGAKRVLPLNVSGAFHSPLMGKAAEKIKQALEIISLKDPCIPIIANVTALPVQDSITIKKHLVEQMTGQVRFRESIQYLEHNGAKTLVEIGNGKVLTGLIKRISPNIQTYSIETPDEINHFIHQEIKKRK